MTYARKLGKILHSCQHHGKKILREQATHFEFVLQKLSGGDRYQHVPFTDQTRAYSCRTLRHSSVKCCCLVMTATYLTDRVGLKRTSFHVSVSQECVLRSELETLTDPSAYLYVSIPSQHRTEITGWILTGRNQHFCGK